MSLPIYSPSLQLFGSHVEPDASKVPFSSQARLTPEGFHKACRLFHVCRLKDCRHVFLGLGLPWFIAGAFWEFGSFDNDEKLTWYKAYKDVAELKKLCDLEGIQDDGSTASNDA